MNRRPPALFLVAVSIVLAMGLTAGRKTTILDTPHNLSTSGRGSIRAVGESRVCVFCHSSHHGSPEGPLWNHQTAAPTRFQVYARGTLSSSPEQPNGATKLCLSCHDGTIAVGAIRGLDGPVPMMNVGAAGEIPTGRRAHLGTDLSGTHPVSIRFQQKAALDRDHLRWPPFDPENQVGTDADGYVQCTSCHDPHGSRSEQYPLWKKETFAQVCQVCHAF